MRGRTRFPSRSRLPRSRLNTPASLTLIEHSAIALHHPRRNPQKERRVASALSSFSFLRKRTNPARFLSENLADGFDAAREITSIRIGIKRNIVIRSRHIMYMSSREGPASRLMGKATLLSATANISFRGTCFNQPGVPQILSRTCASRERGVFLCRECVERDIPAGFRSNIPRNGI